MNLKCDRVASVLCCTIPVFFYRWMATSRLTCVSRAFCREAYEYECAGARRTGWVERRGAHSARPRRGALRGAGRLGAVV